NQVIGKDVRAHNLVGEAIYGAPGAVRSAIDSGMTWAYKTFRPKGAAGPRVHLMNGIRLPNTMNFASLNVVEEFNQHVDEALSVLRKERLETPDGRLDVEDGMLDVLNRLKDDFAKIEDPTGRRDADTIAARRRTVFENFQVAMRDAMTHKLTAKIAAREAKAGNHVNLANIRAEIDTWMREYEKQSNAIVEGFHRKRNETDPAHVSNEYIALGDNDFVQPHAGLAEALDKSTPTTSHRFRWDAFEDFFNRKFEPGKVFNEVSPDGVSVKTLATEVFDEINDHLKWLLLGRPVAYTLRNALESSQRILATQDVLGAFAMAGRGLLNAGANLRRVTTDQVHLAEAQINHAIMERRLMEELSDLQDIHMVYEEMAASLKRKRRSSGAEVNRAAEIKARIEIVEAQLARSREVTGMSVEQWREHMKAQATKGLTKQIEEFEADLSLRQASLDRVDSLKEPTAADLALRDTLAEEIEFRKQALVEARKAKEAAAAARKAEGKKKVRRGNTALRKTAGYEGGLDPKTGRFVPPSMLNAYDNPLQMKQFITDSAQSTNRM